MTRIVYIILIALVTIASPMPQGIDPDRIYTPDDLNELRAAIAYEECLRTPGCNPNPNPLSTVRCKLGSGTDAMMKDMVDVRTNMGCNPMAGQVLWPNTGQCVQLLTQGPCPPGQWVKLSKIRSEPECTQRPCEEGEVLMDGSRCHTMQDRSVCPQTQQLVNNEFGQAECDCTAGKVYHQPTNNCYTPYTQGPCPSGQVIKVIDAGASGRAECVENPCPAPSMVPLDSECHVSSRLGPGNSCHALGTQGPCLTGFLTIDEGLSEPVCLETHTIFNLPNTKLCPRGSRRDLSGRCRRNLALHLENLPPIVTSRPGLQPDGGLCPSGQILMAGICVKLALSPTA